MDFAELVSRLNAATRDEIVAALAQIAEYAGGINPDAVTSADLATMRTLAGQRAELTTELERRDTERAEAAELAAQMSSAYPEPAQRQPLPSQAPNAPDRATNPGDAAPAQPAQNEPAAGQPAEQPAEQPADTGSDPDGQMAVRPPRGAAAEFAPAPRLPARTGIALTAAADVTGYATGQAVTPDDLGHMMAVRIAAASRIRNTGSDGLRLPVATFTADYPADRVLHTGQLSQNTALIEAITAPQAIVAAGGLCAPLTPDYSIDVIGSTARPVRDALATFRADRGGISFRPSIDAATIAAVDAGIGVWTMDDDVAASTNEVQTINLGAATAGTVTITHDGETTAAIAFNATAATVTTALNNLSNVAPGDITVTGGPLPGTITLTFGGQYAGTNVAQVTVTPTGLTGGTVTVATTTEGGLEGGGAPRKICAEVDCVGQIEAFVEAVYMCLQFSNVTSRFDPEGTAANIRASLVAHARFAENRLLAALQAGSKALTAARVLGAARDVLATLDKVLAYYRSRHRLDRNGPRIRVVLPQWVLDMLRVDILRSLKVAGGDDMGMADSVISGWFARRNVNVTWHLDGLAAQGGPPVVAAQAYADAGAGTAVPGFPAQIDMLLWVEGTWLFLDGGTLDLGVVRDSSLNAINRYQQFTETWEGTANRGIESLRVVISTEPTGLVAGTIDTSAVAD